MLIPQEGEKVLKTMQTFELAERVRLAQAGDQLAFTELVEQFEGVIFAIVLKRLRNRTEAAEVTQDVFIQMFRKLDQLRDVERFSGWLKQIAVRLSINRAVRRPLENAQDPETLVAVATAPCSPLENLLRDESAGDVREGLQRLKDLDRATLIAFYIEGQTLKQMSDRFESPIGTIKRRLHTARNRLRDELSALQTVG